MIAGTVPLQIILMRLAARENVARATRLSTLGGLVGLALVVAPGLGAGSTAIGLAVMVIASIFWSQRVVPLEEGDAAEGPVRRDRVGDGARAGSSSLAASVAVGEPGELTSAAFATDSVLAWAYLVVAGSLVGFTAYAWLLRVAPISLVVTHQYVNPLVAIALGVLFLGERPSPLTFVGAVLIVGAVYVAVRAESPRTKSRPATVVPRGTPADRTA